MGQRTPRITSTIESWAHNVVWYYDRAVNRDAAYVLADKGVERFALGITAGKVLSLIDDIVAGIDYSTAGGNRAWRQAVTTELLKQLEN